MKDGYSVVFGGEELAPRFSTRGGAKAYLVALESGKRKPERVKEKKKDNARLLKCECVTCGYISRVARKWIRDVGPPLCPDHGAMICEE